MDTFPHSAADKDSPDGNDDDPFSDALDHIPSLPPFSSSPSPNPVPEPEPEPYSIIAVAEEQDNNNQSSASVVAPAAKKHKPISAFSQPQPQPPPKKSKKKPNNVWTKSTSRKGKKKSNKSALPTPPPPRRTPSLSPPSPASPTSPTTPRTPPSSSPVSTRPRRSTSPTTASLPPAPRATAWSAPPAVSSTDPGTSRSRSSPSDLPVTPGLGGPPRKGTCRPLWGTMPAATGTGMLMGPRCTRRSGKGTGTRGMVKGMSLGSTLACPTGPSSPPSPRIWSVTRGRGTCTLLTPMMRDPKPSRSIVYFLLTIGLEFVPLHTLKFSRIRTWWDHLIFGQRDTPQSYFQPLLGSSDDASNAITNEDADAIAERHRVIGDYPENVIIYLHNLRKVYPAQRNHAAKVAVHSLTFAVQEGECFGFLGTNGAGKTTTCQC